MIVLAFGLLRLLNTTSSNNESATLSPTPAIVSMGQGQERLTVLLAGTSRRPGGETSVEMVMLFGLDPAARTAHLLSIPPELYVPLPGRSPGFLSTAYVAGSADYLRQAVEFNFGFLVPYHAIIAAEAMIALIDLSSGVTIYNSREINAIVDGEPLTLGIGWHMLDGRKALHYARIAQSADSFGQVFEQMQRQQQLMLAMHANLLTTNAAEKLLPQLSQILSALQSSIETNLSADAISRLVLAAKQVPQENVTLLALDAASTQIWNTSESLAVLVPNRAAVRDLRERFLSSTSLQASATSATTAEDSGTVRIQNGTQRRGLAAATRDYLQRRGITVAEIGNAPQAYARSVIVDYRNRPRFTQRLANELGLPLSSIAVAVDTAQAVDALIVLGDDYTLPQRP